MAICGLLGVTAIDFIKRKSGGADFLRLNKAGAEIRISKSGPILEQPGLTRAARRYRSGAGAHQQG